LPPMSILSIPRDGLFFGDRNGSRKARRRGNARLRKGELRRRPRVRATTQVELLETRQLLSATVTTDQQDYAPGSTAVITASNDGGPDNNFLLGPNGEIGETVHFHIDRTDGGTVQAPPAVQDWYVTDGVSGFDAHQDPITDQWIFPDTDGVADGSIGTSWY